MSAILKPVTKPSVLSEKALKLDMKYLVRALLKYNASDLHIKVGRPPLYRINGRLVAAKMPELEASVIEEVLRSVLSPKHVVELELKRQIDLSFNVQELGRFRCHVYYQRGQMAAAVRMIPFVIPHLDDLGVPPVVKELAQKPRGLVLVTGATGMGKSTTLAAMIQHINEHSHLHILSIEDPIEFVYRDQKATVSQREVGSDTPTLKEGLYAAMREDPDVIVIGELRDCDMIQLALTAAETGHLVLSTLHTNDVSSTIERLIEVFPAEARNQVRIQLASTLLGVVCQQLVLRADGSGRVPACEVMVKSPTIESYLMKGELDKIREVISNSNNYYKMQTMGQALEKLVNQKIITEDEAIKCSSNPEELKLKLSGMTREAGYEMGKSFQSKPPSPPPELPIQESQSSIKLVK